MMTTSGPGPQTPGHGPVEDFRARTARLRRAQTGRRLCAAAFDVIDARGLAGLGVDDVHGRAGVSRGAFYRHFPSLDELLDHLAGAVGAQIGAEMTQRFETVADPPLRIGFFLRYQVVRAMSDRPCALLLSRALSRHGASSYFAHEHAVRDFGDAVDAGRFVLASLPVAVDLAHGMLAAIMRRATLDGLDTERLGLETAFLLRACGLPPAEADRLARAPLPAATTSELRRSVLDLCGPDGHAELGGAGG